MACLCLDVGISTIKTPAGERVPFPNPCARGSLHGMSFEHGWEHLARALFEGWAEKKFATAAQNYLEIRDTFEPDAGRHARYREGFEHFMVVRGHSLPI